MRQIDVAVYLRGESHPRFVVDAKRKLTRRATVEIVDQFVGMLDDLGVNAGALVCPHGWTPSAAKRAEAGNLRVELLSVDDALRISCSELGDPREHLLAEQSPGHRVGRRPRSRGREAWNRDLRLASVANLSSFRHDPCMRATRILDV
jgi:hypothetical protein